MSFFFFLSFFFPEVKNIFTLKQVVGSINITHFPLFQYVANSKVLFREKYKCIINRSIQSLLN